MTVSRKKHTKLGKTPLSEPLAAVSRLRKILSVSAKTLAPILVLAVGIVTFVGLKATKPNKGKKINPNSKRVVDYVRYLNARHADALSNAGGGNKVYDYYYCARAAGLDVVDQPTQTVAGGRGRSPRRRRHDG